METRLIMLPNPILVSDAPSMMGMKCYDTSDFTVFEKKYDCKFHEFTNERPVNEWNYKPIVAGLPDLPKLNLSLIAEEIGWVDVEKLAEEKYPIQKGGSAWMPTTHDCIQANKQEGFIEGFKAAQSLNEKKWTDDDMIDFQNFISSYPNRELKRGLTLPYYLEKFKQSRKPKEYLVEVEMEWGGKEYVDEQDAYGYDIKRPKITNNTIKVTKILH